MGNYRDQYEKYYGNIRKQGAASYKRISSYEGNTFEKEKKEKGILNKLIIKFIWQMCGAVILLMLLFGLKEVSMNDSQNELYNKSKDMIDEEFDVNEAIACINISDDEESYKERALDYIDGIKSYVSGERTLKEVVKEDYIQPVKGKIKYINGDSKGIAISSNNNEDDVVSAYGGTIQELRDDDDNKCIVINHGNGTETYYGSLSQLDVEKGETITKGEVIGKCGHIDATDRKGVIFKFIYLGNEKNPSDVMDLSSLEDV